MSGPKHNGRSAPSTCPLNRQLPWWTCWSMRCSIAGLLPWPHRLTTSRNRRCCGGSTGPRSTPSPAPPSTPRSGSSTPSGAFSSRRRTSRRCVRRASGGRSGPAGDGGERHCTRCWAGGTGPPDVHLRGTSAARDRPRRRRENDRHARPHPGLDPRRRPGARPGPVGCRGRRPRRANRHPHRHPRQTHLVTPATATCRTGRQRSGRRHW